MRKKKKYIAIFMLKEQSSYTIKKRKKLNPIKKEISFRDKTYIYNIVIPSYSKGLKQFYLFDIHSTIGHLVFIKNKESLITPEIIDSICKRKTVLQLTSNLTDTAFKVNLMMIFIGLIIGGLIGWIMG
ncbi:unnamed protein product, partial [marine sediment metagenome]